MREPEMAQEGGAWAMWRDAAGKQASIEIKWLRHSMPATAPLRRGGGRVDCLQPFLKRYKISKALMLTKASKL